MLGTGWATAQNGDIKRLLGKLLERTSVALTELMLAKHTYWHLQFLHN